MKRPSSRSLLRTASAAALLCLLCGCATVEGPRDPRDPLEPWNRSVFSFNEAADRVVLKPVATAYRDVVPSLVRQGITNVYRNFSDAWSAVNSLLQLKPGETAHNTLRVAVNTVFGLGGLLDIASEAGIQSYPEDLGQTLGRWGVPAGPYIVWPILGASTLRDSAALPIDLQATPNLLINDPATRHSLTGFQVVHTRSNLLAAGEVLDGAVVGDKYTFVRNAHLQRRQAQVYDGNPPEEDGGAKEERWDLDEAAAAPAGAASAEAPAAPASAASAPLAAAAAQPAASAVPAAVAASAPEPPASAAAAAAPASAAGTGGGVPH